MISVSLFKRGKRFYENICFDGKRLRRALKTTDEHHARSIIEAHCRQFENGKNIRNLAALNVPSVVVSVEGGFKFLSDSTVERYQTSLDKFRIFAVQNNIRYVPEVDESFARLYYRHLLSLGFSGGTIRSHQMALSAIWTANALKSPFTKKGVRVVEGKREDFTPDEVNDILAVNQTASTDLYLVLCFGAYCGMRLGDAVNLEFENIRRFVLDYRTRKTGFHIRYKLGDRMASILKNYLPEFNLKLGTGGKLFPALSLQYRQNRSTVSARLNRAIEKVIRERKGSSSGRIRRISRYSFHSLRHAFIGRLIESGESFLQVRAVTGTSIRLLAERYGDHIRQSDMDRCGRKAEKL